MALTETPASVEPSAVVIPESEAPRPTATLARRRMRLVVAVAVLCGGYVEASGLFPKVVPRAGFLPMPTTSTRFLACQGPPAAYKEVDDPWKVEGGFWSLRQAVPPVWTNCI